MKNSSIYSQVITRLVSDTIAFSISYVFLYYLRFHSGIIPTTIVPSFSAALFTGIVLLVYWLLVFFFAGMYRNWHLRSPFDEIFAVWKVCFIATAIIVLLIFYEGERFTRMMFVLHYLFQSTAVTIGRTICRRIQVKLRAKRIVSIPTIVVGCAHRAIDFYEKAERFVNWGYRVVGIILIDKNQIEDFKKLISEKNLNEIKFDTLDNADAFLCQSNAEEVVITSDQTDHDTLFRIASTAVDCGMRVTIEPDLYSIFTGQTRTQSLYGIPLIEINTQLLKPWQEIAKRLFDIVFSFLVLLIGLPLWIIIAIIIKLDSPGPVIYKQPRVGKNGKVFMIYKFRSMRSEPVPAKQTWTQVNDPRVTKFGRFIRKTHLDEIPQFWNVLIGDMSVVGPRPEQPKIVEEIIKEVPYYKRRHLVRPGITGWWQVKYKSYEFSIDEIRNRLKDDFYYIENFSLKLDFEIIIRTIMLVFRGHGQT